MSQPELQDQAARIKELEITLEELKGITRCLPTEEQAQLALRTDQKLTRLIALAVVPTLVTVAMLVVVVVTNLETRDAANANRVGVQCLLGEMANHRIMNYQVHKDITRRLGITETHETLIPAQDVRELLSECERFYPQQRVSQR